MNKGIFINYQMAEAINLIDNPSTNKTLEDFKNDWLQDTIPGYNVKIGTSIPGMQDITLDEVYELREQAQQADTYTVQNCAAMQYCIVLDENKKDSTLKALNDAKKFIRRVLADRVDVRHIPELEFVYDESIEYGKKIENIIEDIHNNE